MTSTYKQEQQEEYPPSITIDFLRIETVKEFHYPKEDKKKNNLENHCFERYRDGPLHFLRMREEEP